MAKIQGFDCSYRLPSRSTVIPVDKDRRAHVLASIASAQGRAGSTKDAGATARLAVRIARSINDSYKRALALSSIASAQATAGRTEEARETARSAVETAKSIDAVISRTHALATIASSQAKPGLTEEAEVTLQAVDLSEITSETYDYGGYALSSIASAQAEAGNFEAARKTIDLASEQLYRATRDNQLRRFLLVRMLEAQKKGGDVEGAREIAHLYLHSAQSLAEKQAESLHIGDLRQVSAFLLESGDTEGAKLATRLALKAAGAKAAASAKAVHYNRTHYFVGAARAQVEMGDRIGGRRTLRLAIEDAKSRNDTRDLIAIASVQVETGNVQDARPTLRDLLRAAKASTEDNKDPADVQSSLEQILNVVAKIPQSSLHGHEAPAH